MSFILDALRKSEHERQRSAAPGLSQVPLATPRRELPGWALLVMGVLAAAVLVMGGAWWQSQRSVSAPSVTPPSVVASSAPSPAATPVVPSPTTAPTPAPAAAAANAPSPPAAAPASAPASPPTEPPAVVTESASLRDSALTPPVEGRSQSLASAATVTKPSAPTSPTLPSVAALLAQGIDVPPLRLELHGYSDKPAERFVFINGHKYREGERLTEGPQVVAVEPNGVVLSQQGRRFLLAPE